MKDTKKLNIMGKQKEEKLNKYIMEGFEKGCQPLWTNPFELLTWE
ncbi:hypothetical protein MmTuc01_0149 [Methanosarcina mazei Tuc01]|uniref:Uncharacterized protein n=1 Tax=Methanosarcina mazei Tuc01 TaxID=1236903 RepID=M1QF38_METMZ|nr:hypothetical protein MmTuc01_0149 [Methanosarcina mazei Tuc01]